MRFTTTAELGADTASLLTSLSPEFCVAYHCGFDDEAEGDEETSELFVSFEE